MLDRCLSVQGQKPGEFNSQYRTKQESKDKCTSGRCSALGPASRTTTRIDLSSASRLATVRPLYRNSLGVKIEERLRENDLRCTSAHDDVVVTSCGSVLLDR